MPVVSGLTTGAGVGVAAVTLAGAFSRSGGGVRMNPAASGHCHDGEAAQEAVLSAERWVIGGSPWLLGD